MDSSHVSLVALKLNAEGFDRFRCDKKTALGLNLGSLSKVLKCAGNDDVITIKCEDGGDDLNLMFESSGQDRISECVLFVFSSPLFGIFGVVHPC